MAFLNLPLGTQLAPQAAGVSVAPQPFVWGDGGVKLTPAQILAQQEEGTRLSQPDYSPVSSIAQGVGRVFDNLRGAIETKSANKAASALQARNMSVAQALADGDKNAIGAAYASGDPALVDYAGKIYDTANPKAPALGEFEKRLIAAGIQPGTPEWARMNLGAAQNISDPIVSIPTPFGAYAGPKSQFLPQMQQFQGGGGPVSSQPGGGVQPPATLPPDFDFGGPTPQASGTFRR